MHPHTERTPGYGLPTLARKAANSLLHATSFGAKACCGAAYCLQPRELPAQDEELQDLLEPDALFPNRLWVIPNRDQDPAVQGPQSFAYIILNEQSEALLVDVGLEPAAKAVRELVQEHGWTVVGLVLTHWQALKDSVKEQQSTVKQIAEEYDIPVFLHPEEANSDMARQLDIDYHDPINHPLLERFHLQMHHTPGHLLVYLKDHSLWHL